MTEPDMQPFEWLTDPPRGRPRTIAIPHHGRQSSDLDLIFDSDEEPARSFFQMSDKKSGAYVEDAVILDDEDEVVEKSVPKLAFVRRSQSLMLPKGGEGALRHNRSVSEGQQKVIHVKPLPAAPPSSTGSDPWTRTKSSLLSCLKPAVVESPSSDETSILAQDDLPEIPAFQPGSPVSETAIQRIEGVRRLVEAKDGSSSDASSDSPKAFNPFTTVSRRRRYPFALRKRLLDPSPHLETIQVSQPYSPGTLPTLKRLANRY